MDYYKPPPKPEIKMNTTTPQSKCLLYTDKQDSARKVHWESDEEQDPYQQFAPGGHGNPEEDINVSPASPALPASPAVCTPTSAAQKAGWTDMGDFLEEEYDPSAATPAAKPKVTKPKVTKPKVTKPKVKTKKLSALASSWTPKSSIKKNQQFYVRYNKNKSAKEPPMRILKIASPPHFNSKYKQGLIIRALDLSDIEKSDIQKVFYFDKLEIIEECFKKFS